GRRARPRAAGRPDGLARPAADATQRHRHAGREPSPVGPAVRLGPALTKVIVGYTTSIDGFVADEQGGVERLYPDLADLQDKPYMRDLIDELHVDVMPLLLGSGLRFWGADQENLHLETIDVSRAGERTTLRYRVVR